MKVHFSKCVCERGHVVFAVAYNPEMFTAQRMRDALEKSVTIATNEKKIPAKCPMRHSTEKRYEDAETNFVAMAPAIKHLIDMQNRQILTRANMFSSRN